MGTQLYQHIKHSQQGNNSLSIVQQMLVSGLTAISSHLRFGLLLLEIVLEHHLFYINYIRYDYKITILKEYIWLI